MAIRPFSVSGNSSYQNAHLHKALRTLPCGRSGRLERERRAADERTGRNGSARIGSRPEDLTTKQQTSQRDLQQGRSLENRQGQEILREGGRGSKTSGQKSKIARESKKGMPTGSIFSRPTTDTRGRSRPK